MSRPVRLAGTADFRIADMQRAKNGVFVDLALRLHYIFAYSGDRLVFGEVEHSTLGHDR